MLLQNNLGRIVSTFDYLYILLYKGFNPHFWAQQPLATQSIWPSNLAKFFPRSLSPDGLTEKYLRSVMNSQYIYLDSKLLATL